MKRLLALGFSLLICGAALSQITGEVYYNMTVNLHKRLPDNDRGNRMREFLPETMDVKNVLILDKTESLYKAYEDSADAKVDFEDEEDRRKSFLKKRLAPPNDVTYINTESGEVVEKKEFMDKVFLIEDSVSLSRWKMTGEMMEVSGYNCMKAEFLPPEGDTNEVYIWFTPEIVSSAGPAGYGGLPGLILYVNVNDGEVVISLDKIVTKEIEKGVIEKPKKGKKVTKAEFEEIRRKKMEEQRKNWGGHGHGGGRH